MNEQLTLLGQSVTSAYQFMVKFYCQIGQLITELDRQLVDTGKWQAQQKGEVTSDMSNGFFPECWLAEYFFRFYVPVTSPNEFHTTIGFVLRLNPSGTDQPMLMGVVAQYPNPKTLQSVYVQWKKSDHTIKGLIGCSTPRPLTDPEIADFLPGATVTGLAVPLCGITGAETLRTQVVNPLLAVLGQSEAKSD